jgi:hypothetical protein
MNELLFHCSQCGQDKPVNREGGTGYATLDNGYYLCYECCGINDRNKLLNSQPGDRFTQYLVFRNDCQFITNWPGTMEITPFTVSKGSHNMARYRYDTWFCLKKDNGEKLYFHGVTYGDMTQIHHVRRLKRKTI